MAITPTTLKNLIDAARLRVDMRQSQYLSDTEITSYINASLSKLDAILVSKFDDYKLTSTTLAVNPGTNQISLPNDFIKLKGVDVWYNNPDPNGFRTLRQIAWEDRNQFNTMNGIISLIGNYDFFYMLRGAFVYILPPQSAANYHYKIWYTPDYIPLVNSTDTLQSYMDSQMWFDYAILDTAAKILTMQDQTETAQLYMAQAAEMRDHIIKLATPNRNSGEPLAVADTRFYNNTNGYGWSW